MHYSLSDRIIRQSACNNTRHVRDADRIGNVLRITISDEGIMFMQTISSWDWEPGKRTVTRSIAPLPGHEWQEEPQVSPNGERFAAVAKTGDGDFAMRVDDETWEQTFEKLWLPRFSPDGRLTALGQLDGEWTMVVDGEPWPETYGYVWGTMFSQAGDVIAASVQQDAQYGLSVGGQAWETLYENANQPALSLDGGRSAAVVQTVPLGQADVETFKQGVYSVAVDGQAWDRNFMNVWSPVFDSKGERVAAQVRLTYYDYSIAVDGRTWDAVYNCVWEPAFNPVTGEVAAPFRAGGLWGMAVDGRTLWEPRFLQCWKQQYGSSGKDLWAVVAPEYGRFTVARNAAPWTATFPVVTDLVLSPAGDRAAAIGSENNADFRIMVDGVVWDGVYDMAWPPVFSPDGRHVAVMVEKDGRKLALLDGKPYAQGFDHLWPPIFGPEGDRLLLRGVIGSACQRIVAKLTDF